MLPPSRTDAQYRAIEGTAGANHKGVQVPHLLFCWRAFSISVANVSALYYVVLDCVLSPLTLTVGGTPYSAPTRSPLPAGRPKWRDASRNRRSEQLWRDHARQAHY
eukprot:1071644-Prymnesium_polylepis.1